MIADILKIILKGFQMVQNAAMDHAFSNYAFNILSSVAGHDDSAAIDGREFHCHYQRLRCRAAALSLDHLKRIVGNQCKCNMVWTLLDNVPRVGSCNCKC